MVDLRQSEEYGQYMKCLGWKVNKGVFVKLLPLGIKFIKWQRPEKIELVKDKAFLIKIEPNVLRSNKKIVDKLKTFGFKQDRSPMLSTKTIWLDLQKTQDQLLKGMHSKTRYNIKKHEQEVRVIKGDLITENDLKKFYKIYVNNVKQRKFWGLSYKNFNDLFSCFKDKAYLLMTSEGGLTLLIHDLVAYYSHNAVTKKGRQQFLPTTLTFEAIKLAKKLKCKRFDFEGIADERYPVTRKWKGFSRFKKSFGGTEVEYIGSFSKYCWRCLWPVK